MGYSSAGDALGGLLVALWSWVMCLGWIIPMMLAAALLIVWIVALVDLLQRDPADFPNARAGRDDPSERTIWLLIVLLVGVIGGVVYYVIVMRPYPRSRPGAPVPPATG